MVFRLLWKPPDSIIPSTECTPFCLLRYYSFFQMWRVSAPPQPEPPPTFSLGAFHYQFSISDPGTHSRVLTRADLSFSISECSKKPCTSACTSGTLPRINEHFPPIGLIGAVFRSSIVSRFDSALAGKPWPYAGHLSWN